MWTFANSGEPSGLADIFKGQSPFDDGGDLEVIGVQTYHSCQMRPKNSLLD
jgi:hypothetical protein